MTTYLADTSALARMGVGTVGERLAPLILAGEVATCGVIDLEVGVTARNKANHEELCVGQASMPRAPLNDASFARALQVQGLLAVRAQHRGVSIPDLLVAAAAEAAGLVVLHYDADYDLIAAVTGQTVEWVVPRGSVD